MNNKELKIPSEFSLSEEERKVVERIRQDIEAEKNRIIVFKNLLKEQADLYLQDQKEWFFSKNNLEVEDIKEKFKDVFNFTEWDYEKRNKFLYHLHNVFLDLMRLNHIMNYVEENTEDLN